MRWTLVVAVRPFRHSGLQMEEGDVQRVPANVATVAHVHCDGVHVNWRQVQDGLAWCFHKYLTQPAVCLPIEREARDAKRGLWRDESPMPPWEFRASAASNVERKQ